MLIGYWGETDDLGTMQARYTTENDSSYGQWLHLYRSSGSLSRFPMYDNIGSARGLLDASVVVTDTHETDTFGRPVSSTGLALPPRFVPESRGARGALGTYWAVCAKQ
jgi:hypothetical protein